MFPSFKPCFRLFFFGALLLPTVAGAAAEKTFFITQGLVVLRNHIYQNGTALEVISTDGIEFTYIGDKGKIQTVPKEAPVGTFLTVPWDETEHRPVYGTPADTIFQRYFYFVTTRLNTWWGFFTYLLLLTYISKPLWTAKNEEAPGCLAGGVLVCVFGAFVGHIFNSRIEEQAKMGKSFFEGHILPGGHVTPVSAVALQPPSFVFFATEGWQLFFWGSTVIALACIPWALKQIFQVGFYYFSPHPARRYLVARAAKDGTPGVIHVIKAAGALYSGNLRKPPPAVVSEVRKKQSKALRERLEEETKLMGSMVDRERKRAELKDEQGES